jgi:outer membrane protein assembly factor BamD
MKRHKYLALMLIAAISTGGLAACTSWVTGGDEEDEEQFTQAPLEQLYNEGWDFLISGRYLKAIEKFEEVERLYPSSPWATRAKVMSAYASYADRDYDSAVPALESFVRMHPANPNTAYAYYLIALSYYERISDVGRDQEMTELALSSLADVTKRFPDTAYARDAKIKTDLVYDHLAGKEMEIGRYYQRRGEFLAAINRFTEVINSYQTTSHTPEALHRLTECYYAIGVEGEAKRYAAVLGYNYPDNIWYKRSYKLLARKGEKVDQGWFSSILGESASKKKREKKTEGS